MAESLRARHNKQVQQQQHPRQQRLAATKFEEEEEIFVDTISLPYRKAYDMAEKFATTSIGQFMIIRGDRLLKIIETTAKWSLPQDQMDDKLKRPLPWIPFLMIIIALRLARVWVSIGALIIGNAPVKAQDVVYFIQSRRRKLRALRLRGIKEICRRESEVMAKKSGCSQNTFTAQLKRFFSIAICRPGQHREPERRIMIQCGKEVICVETDSSEQQVAKRPRADHCEADMTLDELLNKYADDNTEDDSDFVPNTAEEDTNDDSDTSSETSESTDATETLVEGNAAEQSNEHKNQKSTQRYSKDKDSSLNQSVEFKENGNGEPINIPKPKIEIKQEISSDKEGSEKVKTPHENGPSYVAENREVDVAFKFVLTPPGIENGNNKHMTPTMEIENSYKATPGHRSAAAMKIYTGTALEAASLAAYEKLPTIDLTTNDTSSDAADSTVTETDIDIENSFNISYTDSSPTLSAASSSTSLESFIKNEEIFSKTDAHSMATSTPPKNIDTTNDLENATKTSVSSSEDDFYSLIGSPPDFNAFQQQQKTQMNLKFNNISSSINQSNKNTLQKTVSEPHIGNNPIYETFNLSNPAPSVRHNKDYQKTVSEPHIGENPIQDTFNLNNPVPSARRNQHHNSYHGNGPHRYRGRNRRN